MAEHMHAIGVLEVAHVVIVDVAVDFRARPPRHAARGDRAHRVRAHDPIDHVDVVQVLLHHLVAADPHELVPVAVLELHVGPLGIAHGRVIELGGNVPAKVQDRPAVHGPVGVRRDDIADRAVLDLGDGIEVLLVRMPLRARDHHQLQLLRLPGGLHELAHVDRIGAERLLAEDVLFGFHRGDEMHRVVGRRRADHDDVDVACQHLLVSVEAEKHVLGIHLELLLELLRGLLLHVGDAAVEPVLEQLADGHKLHVVVSRPSVEDRLGPAHPYPEDAEFQHFLTDAAHLLRASQS